MRIFCFDSAFQHGIGLLFRLLVTDQSARCGRAVGEFYFCGLGPASRCSRDGLSPEVAVHGLEPGAPLCERLPEVGRLSLKLIESTVGTIGNADRDSTRTVAFIVVLHPFGVAVERTWKMCLKLLDLLV